MWPNPESPADSVTFTKEILNGKLRFLYSYAENKTLVYFWAVSKEWKLLIIYTNRYWLYKHYWLNEPYVSSISLLWQISVREELWNFSLKITIEPVNNSLSNRQICTNSLTKLLKGNLFCMHRSSRQRCSVRKDALRNSAKFTGKHLCQSLFFNKVAGLGLQIY